MAKRLYIQLYNAKTGESLTLPLNPETTDIPTSREIKTYNVLDYGEVAVKGDKQLKRITLSNVLPDSTTVFSLLASMIRQMNYKTYTPQEAMSMLNSWVENGDIIRVIISGYLNAEFYIETHTSQVRESIADLGYNIELVEYRSPEGESSVFTATKGKLVKLKERVMNKYVPAQLTGQAGQTIYKIAKLTYGGKFQELADKNGITNPNLSVTGEIVEMLPI